MPNNCLTAKPLTLAGEASLYEELGVDSGANDKEIKLLGEILPRSHVVDDVTSSQVTEKELERPKRSWKSTYLMFFNDEIRSFTQNMGLLGLLITVYKVDCS